MGHSPWSYKESDTTEQLTHTHTHMCTCTHTYTTEYYEALKRKDVLTHATTWMNVEDIMLTEVSQSQKDKQHMILLI